MINKIQNNLIVQNFGRRQHDKLPKNVQPITHEPILNKNEINVIITKEGKMYTAKVPDLLLFKLQSEDYFEVTKNLKPALKKHIDILNNSGVCYPAKYDNIEKITLNTNSQTFLQGSRKLFRLPGLSNISGIDRGQLNDYQIGRNMPRKEQIEKINKAISNLCEELNNTKILADKEVENITAAY